MSRSTPSGNRPHLGASSDAPMVRPVERNMVREILRGALGFSGPLAIPAEDDTGEVHPNGFLKIPLGVDPTGRRIFLHVWQDASADQCIHDHRWSFASTVLSGSLTNAIFDLSAPGGSPAEPLLVSFYTPAADDYTISDSGAGLFTASQRSKKILETGREYVQGSTLLHRASGKAGTVTLVARGRPTSASSRVLSAKPMSPAPQTNVQLERRDRDRIISSVLTALALSRSCESPRFDTPVIAPPLPGIVRDRPGTAPVAATATSPSHSREPGLARGHHRIG